METFLGAWRDSMGNKVQVEWARPGSRGGQLDVRLSKPRSDRDPIRLNIKHLGSGRFSCGHYDLNIEESDAQYIVWEDYKKKGKRSVWERDGKIVAPDQQRQEHMQRQQPQHQRPVPPVMSPPPMPPPEMPSKDADCPNQTCGSRDAQACEGVSAAVALPPPVVAVPQPPGVGPEPWIAEPHLPPPPHGQQPPMFPAPNAPPPQFAMWHGVAPPCLAAAPPSSVWSGAPSPGAWVPPGGSPGAWVPPSTDRSLNPPEVAPPGDWSGVMAPSSCSSAGRQPRDPRIMRLDGALRWDSPSRSRSHSRGRS